MTSYSAKNLRNSTKFQRRWLAILQKTLGIPPKSKDDDIVGESVGVRPRDPAEQQRISYADRYGHEKLCAEEALASGLAEGSPDQIKNDKRVVDAYLGAQ